MNQAEGVLLSSTSTDQMSIKEAGVGGTHPAMSKSLGTIA